jgi:class 3 adenylate cyclase
MANQQVYRWEVDFDVPRRELWPIITDTQRINRLAGDFAIAYEYKPLETGGSETIGRASKGGWPFCWIEYPGVWVEPERYYIDRHYLKGPWRRLQINVELIERNGGKGTHLVYQATVDPRGWLGSLVTRIGSVAQERGFRRAFDLAAQWAKEGQMPPPEGSFGQSESALRRASAELMTRFFPLAEALEIRPAAEKLLGFLQTQPPNEIASLAPYQLADRWQVSRDKALLLFLRATREGLFDMQYNLICPSCRRAKTVFTALSEVTQSGHCPTCNIDFGVDFDRAVEVRFSPAPLGLNVEQLEYCHSGPQNTPHRVAAFCIEPAGESSETVVLSPGRYQLSAPQCRGAVFCEATSDGETNARIELRSDGLFGVPSKIAQNEPLALTWVNRLSVAAHPAIARTAWADDAVTAAELTALQEFRDLFSSEILAPGAEFGLRNLVFLFSDLVGSTAMYERIGDAPAFALVRDHFDLLKEIYLSQQGSLVKTIGDAVMAVFRHPEQALLAAVQMHERIAMIRDRQKGEPLSLRIGLHQGPCIAMEANGLVDYFGTTVNLAARVQGQAGPGEIALSPAIGRSQHVQEILEHLPYQKRRKSGNAQRVKRRAHANRGMYKEYSSTIRER